MPEETRISPSEAQARLEAASDNYLVFMERHGDTLGYYAPRGIDDQTPHDRDEIYVVAKGTGTFRRGNEVVSFAPGDYLFVAAREEHRFETFTDDFGAWVIFFGEKS